MIFSSACRVTALGREAPSEPGIKRQIFTTRFVVSGNGPSTPSGQHRGHARPKDGHRLGPPRCGDGGARRHPDEAIRNSLTTMTAAARSTAPVHPGHYSHILDNTVGKLVSLRILAEGFRFVREETA